LNTISGAEYSCTQLSGYQDSPTFNGLDPESDYTFYARMKATASYYESPDGPLSAVITTNAAPKVTGISIAPATASVQKGQTQAFTAAVTQEGGASTSVSWSIVGDHHSSTTISAAGVLSVNAAETEDELTVRVTSAFDNNFFADATVTLTAAPAVKSVVVTAASTSVMKSKTVEFTVDVTVEGGASKAVTWSIVGSHHAGTTLSAGVLTVSASETASTITVRATSQFNSAIYGEATVTVVPLTAIENIEQETTARIYAAGGVLYIDLAQPETVKIYNVSGALIRTFEAPAGKSEEALARGVYIVKTASKTVKVAH